MNPILALFLAAIPSAQSGTNAPQEAPRERDGARTEAPRIAGTREEARHEIAPEVSAWADSLAARITDRNPDIARSARVALVALGKDAEPSLRRCADSRDAEVARAATHVLEQVRMGPPRPPPFGPDGRGPGGFPPDLRRGPPPDGREGSGARRGGPPDGVSPRGEGHVRDGLGRDGQDRDARGRDGQGPPSRGPEDRNREERRGEGPRDNRHDEARDGDRPLPPRGPLPPRDASRSNEEHAHDGHGARTDRDAEAPRARGPKMQRVRPNEARHEAPRPPDAAPRDEHPRPPHREGPI